MKARPFPYFWPTWLAGLLSGEKQCEYAAHFRGHWQGYEKKDDGFDFARWKEDHQALLRQDRERLEADGIKTYTEDQNKFTWKGKTADIGGKPDLVGIKTAVDHKIYEYKTGKTRDSDMEQVKIYLCALPRTLDRHIGRILTGEVVYGRRNPKGEMEVTQRLEVPAQSVDLAFKERFTQLISRVASPHPARAVPSEQECQYCDLSLICEFRYKPEPQSEGEAWF